LAGDQLEGSILAANKYQKRFGDRNFVGGAGEDGGIAIGWRLDKVQKTSEKRGNGSV